MCRIIDTKSALETLGNLIDTFVEPEAFTKFLKQQSRFHKYSFRNSLLIQLQLPEATYVAGFQAWINKHGRAVRKGEKSIKILAPLPYQTEDKDGNPKSGIFFRVVSVFDVSQTDPIEGSNKTFVPEAFILLDDDRGLDLYSHGIAWMIADGCTVQSTDAKGTSAAGWYAHANSEIYVKPAPNLRMLEVLIHEIAHRRQKFLSEKADYGYAGNEVVVESAAYVVCQHFGLDVAMSAVPYVRSWLQSDRKAFEKGLATISKLSEEIILALNDIHETFVDVGATGVDKGI